MPTKFIMTRDINGYNGFGVDFSDINFQVTLSANVAQSFTVPSSYQEWIAIFSIDPGSSIWFARNTTAEVSTGSIRLTASQLNPAARRVLAGDVISMITDDATNDEVGVSLYAISSKGTQ